MTDNTIHSGCYASVFFTVHDSVITFLPVYLKILNEWDILRYRYSKRYKDKIMNFNLNQYFINFLIKLEGIFNVKPLQQQCTALKKPPLIMRLSVRESVSVSACVRVCVSHSIIASLTRVVTGSGTLPRSSPGETSDWTSLQGNYFTSDRWTALGVRYWYYYYSWHLEW